MICAGDLKKPKANGEIYLEWNSMETKPGRNFLWILTLNNDYIIIIAGAAVQTSSFFRIARGRHSSASFSHDARRCATLYQPQSGSAPSRSSRGILCGVHHFDRHALMVISYWRVP